MKATSLGFQQNFKAQTKSVIEVVNPIPEENKIVKTQSSNNKLIIAIILAIFLLSCTISLAIWYHIVSKNTV